ncbi:outer membrane protein transport protein [Dyadobacter sp. CY312]|uniref:outer membrane protein transport protein n=1 Tax=Dyadobacter sp. CY312 TaxID=2907303 RepID=UPI001F489D02|nr:outer membrane protein transport protein [Dyadobacter sp. CY312]MCE7040966.1 outer membrane protein transport protein [Dyadobacter sp. CY312]
MSLYKGLGILAVAITLGCNGLTPTQANAQGLGNAPYSSLGMGELYGESFSDNTGMGQSGVSTSNGFQINNLNPALWSRNKYTTLDVGLIGQYKEIVSGNKKQQNAGGNLAYVSIAFPVGRRWTLGASMKPYSFVDFENTSTRAIPGTGDQAAYFNSGKGGINKASITNAYQLNQYVSLGLETSYYFGNVRKATEVLIPSGAAATDYLVGINDRTNYSDFGFRAGGTVRIPVKKDNKLNLNLGGAYSFKTDINASQTRTLELSQDSFVLPGATDTLTNNMSGSITVPTQYQVGMSLEWPLKMVVSADYSHQSWSDYRGFRSTSNDGLKNVGRLHVGVEYLPRFLSLNYFERVRYRVGFSHGKTPYSINNRDVNDTNISLGFTFPMGFGYQNFVSLAFVGGQRGNTGNGMVRERYGRAVLGITLLDRWFQKQKLD